ncbi:hypothetical protein [Streptomyces sp. NPDC097619]|uniref:hypothetical protein n=1 Tax=Streptomyces sp. NPDC097619 TaxID=3157228 RepID=UPI0033321038
MSQQRPRRSPRQGHEPPGSPTSDAVPDPGTPRGGDGRTARRLGLAAAALTTAAALALSACALSTEASTPPPVPTTATAAPPPPTSTTRTLPTPATTPPPASAPGPAPTSAEQQLVTVTRSGGFTGGEHKSVLVAGDGSYVRLDHGKRTGSGRLSAEGLARLRSALAAAGFPRLPRVLFERRSPDAFTYAFVHAGREVAAQDGSMPRTLSAVLAALPPF